MELISNFHCVCLLPFFLITLGGIWVIHQVIIFLDTLCFSEWLAGFWYVLSFFSLPLVSCLWLRIFYHVFLSLPFARNVMLDDNVVLFSSVSIRCEKSVIAGGKTSLCFSVVIYY